METSGAEETAVAASAGAFRMPVDARQTRPAVSYPRTVLFGEGVADFVGEEARQFGSRALLLTYDAATLPERGGVDRVRDSLETARIDVDELQLGGKPDLPSVTVSAGRIAECRTEVIVALGGGSVIDVAKASSALAANGGTWAQYQLGEARLREEGVPVIAIPTTAGTGAETTSVAVIENAERGLIKSVGDRKLLPEVAIVDPSLTWSCPPRLTAAVGLDALTHALESYLSPRASRLTRALSLEALRLVAANVRRATADGEDREARTALSLGSHLAGQALAAGAGAAHILAQPISAVLHVSHGEALSAVISSVLAFNEQQPSPLYGDLLTAMASDEPTLTRATTALLTDLGLPKSLTAIGGREHDIPAITSNVLACTSHVWTNVRAISIDDVRQILERAL